MTLTVGLLGYPEAILATDTLMLDLPATPTASAVIENVATRSPRLRQALLLDNGTPRLSVKVLVDGTPVNHASTLPATGAVTVLGALPCDG